MTLLAPRLDDGGLGEAISSGAFRLGVAAACALVLASLLSPLLVGWLRRRLPEQEGEARRAAGTLRAAVVLLGLYAGVDALPTSHRAVTIVESVLFVLVVVLLARAAGRLLSLLLRAYVVRRAEGPERERAQSEYLPLFSTALTVALGLFAFALVAHHFGHDVSSVVAAFGVGSLAIGLAAQQTLGNTIAGFLLLVDRPFRPGDVIRLQSGESGTIEEIGIRSTRIVLPEGNLLVVPNAEMANTRVVNLSQPAGRSRAEVKVKVPWALAEAARAALAEAARAEVSPEDPAPVVRVATVEAEVIEVAVQLPARTADRQAVEDRIRGAALSVLAAARERRT